MRTVLEPAIVLCAAFGFYALLSLVGLFPNTTGPIVLAGAGAFGAYVYGRFARHRGTTP